jgi:hypothetical protein
MEEPQRPYGVLGVFLVLLGAGLILDADWTWRGAAVMAAGAACLLAEWRQAAGR